METVYHGLFLNNFSPDIINRFLPLPSYKLVGNDLCWILVNCVLWMKLLERLQFRILKVSLISKSMHSNSLIDFFSLHQTIVLLCLINIIQGKTKLAK